MKKKILLTGASGAVGFETFLELLRRADRYVTRVFSLGTKSERRAFRPYSSRAEFVWGDLRDPQDIRRAVDGVDVVLHVAGIIPPLADHHPDLAWAVNVGGTKNLLKAVRAQDRPPKVVFTSSISVYGDRVHDPYITVGDPLQPSEGDEYARTKIAAEELIQESGVGWTIFRLCGILVGRLGIQPLMFHMPLDTALEWCHASDAGYALVQAIEEEALLGRIFNLGGGERCRISARSFLQKMFAIWGLDPEIVPEYAFATRNFHSGYYADGDVLEDLLHFRRKTLQDYLDEVQAGVSPLQRRLVRWIPKPLVRAWLLRMSEPLAAIRMNDEAQITRYYGSRQAFERIFHRA